nr:Mobile element protein [Proteus mirabilis]
MLMELHMNPFKGRHFQRDVKNRTIRRRADESIKNIGAA